MKLLTSLILCVALTGCGEVVVFGHVVRENPSKAEATASQPAAEAAAPAPVTPEPAAAQTSAAPAAANASSGAELAAPDAAVGAVSSSGHLLHAVDVKLSPESQASVSGVDAAALLDAIRTELRSRKLLDEQSASADGTAEVLIEGATTHPTVNAVVFGFQPMAGMLTGELQVRSSGGAKLPSSKIVAETRYNVADDDPHKNALGPLYRRFAVLTADQLAAMAQNPNSGAGIQPQRR